MRTVCVEAERKNTKQNNQSWLEGLLTVREYQNFLEEGKLVVGVASVACVVSRHCPIFMICWHLARILFLVFALCGYVNKKVWPGQGSR